MTPIRTSSSPVLDEGVANRERCADRALGVVLVRDRSTEDGHYRVADELLHRSAAPLELGAHLRVVRLQHPAHVLGIEPLGPRCEADEVAEEAGDDLALLAAATSASSDVAHREQIARVLGVLAAAARADLHAGRIGARMRRWSCRRPAMRAAGRLDRVPGARPEGFELTVALAKTQYVRSGDADIAYQVIGDGAHDIVLAFDFASHLEEVTALP